MNLGCIHYVIRPFETHMCPNCLSPSPSLLQDGVRVHAINRETGHARVWQLPLAFFANFEGNAYDTEGVKPWAIFIQLQCWMLLY